MNRSDRGEQTADGGQDAATPIPDGCVEIMATEVKNCTQFVDGARWGYFGTRLRMTTPTSPIAGYPNMVSGVWLDQPVARPSSSTPVTLAVGSADANQLTAPNLAMVYAYNSDNTKWVQFVATEGSVTLTAATNDEQVAGAVSNLKFVEVEQSIEGNGWRSTRAIPGGRCLFLRHQNFDTRVAGGCDPAVAASCGAGKTCKPLNRLASDGVCVDSTGTLAPGASCTLDPVTGASARGVGSVCTD